MSVPTYQEHVITINYINKSYDNINIYLHILGNIYGKITFAVANSNNAIDNNLKN